MVSQIELISKGYHSLVPGIAIILEQVWVPLRICLYSTVLKKLKPQLCFFLKNLELCVHFKRCNGGILHGSIMLLKRIRVFQPNYLNI